MIRRHAQRVQSGAFTLVELLVVIAIIAILVGLTAAGVMRVLNKIPEIKTRHEIAQMDQGIQSFMSDYGLQYPPPSFLYLSEDGTHYQTMMSSGTATQQLAAKQTVAFLQQWLGKNFNISGKYDWNGNGKIDPPYILEGEQCLVFYLGGIPAYAPTGNIAMTGFSPNISHPDQPATPGSTRKGPYVNFQTIRLTMTLYPGTNRQTKPFVNWFFPVYLDAWLAKSGPDYGPDPYLKDPQNQPLHHQYWGPQPYAYFSSSGKMNGYNLTTSTPTDVKQGFVQGDCTTVLANGYYQLMTTMLPNYNNSNSYQILSAGQDGVFWFDKNVTFPGGVPWNPAAIAEGAGKDDMANFSSSFLGNGQQ
jgi:prepilin-type N-terminal cleavage/methylation domain-containing protein